MNIVVGMRIARKCKNPSASNLAEVVDIYPDGNVRLQHLEGGKRQTIVITKSLLTNWKPAPPFAPLELDGKVSALELGASEHEKRIGALETKISKLLAALGEG